jgi:hypothetical protein
MCIRTALIIIILPKVSLAKTVEKLNHLLRQCPDCREPDKVFREAGRGAVAM